MAATIRQLGRQMRERRTALGLTLRQLAEQTGLSPAMLCHVEKGQANPSVQSLAVIADALRCPPSSLLSEATQPDTAAVPPCWAVLPGALRSWLELDGGIRVSALTPGPGAGVNFVEVIYPPGAVSGVRPFRHAGREWGLVLAGELTAELPDGTVVVKTGDSIVLDSRLPHRFRNAGVVPMRAVWANFHAQPGTMAPPGEPIRPRRARKRVP